LLLLVSEQFSPLRFAVSFADIGHQLDSLEDEKSALDAITAMATRTVPGADYAGITIGRSGSTFVTVGATAELVNTVDQIQYDLGGGPCVDAIVENTTFNAPDLRVDPRWPEFGHRAVEITGIISMLSLRLYSETDHGMIAGLNMYSRSAEAFDESSEAIAVLLATHGALAVGKATAQAKAANLLQALKTNREIGIAIGILMGLHKLTREQAFDLLRIASQHTHRKISDIAGEVADTGALPEVPTTRPTASHRTSVETTVGTQMVQLVHRDGKCVVVLSGDVDAQSVERVRAVALATIATTDADEIIIDLSAVPFIDSTGLSALVVMRNAAAERDLPTRIVGAQPQARQVLTITALAEVFGVIGDTTG
jgi:anti-anti-sigma factor